MRLAIFFINLTLAYLLLSGWPDFLPSWVKAVLVLVLVMAVIPLRGVSGSSGDEHLLRSLRVPQWMDYLYIGGVIFCVELLLLGVFTLGPESSEELHDEAVYWLSSEDESGGGAADDAPKEMGAGGGGNWLWDRHFRRSHPKQVDLKLRNKPEIFMRLEGGASREELMKYSLYLRTFALANFDGETWSIHEPTKLILEKGGGGDIELGRLSERGAGKLPVYEHRITQPYYEDGQNLLTSLHSVVSTDFSSVTKVSSDAYMLNGVDEDSYQYSYRVRSQPMVLDHLLEIDGDLSAGEVHSVYLSRVSNPVLQDKLTKFADSVDRSLSVGDQLLALKKLINAQCSYSLKIENKGGVNALENFLFVEKVGYCEFYASAAAMLCRELGIPSRVAFGWSGGKFFKGSDLFVFRTKHAHAWTEVYLDGYGWVVYDTTPPSETMMTESGGSESPPDASELNDKGYSDVSDLDDGGGGFITWFGVVVVLVLFVVLVVLLLVLRRRVHPPQSSASAVYFRGEPRYLQVFQKLSSDLGYPIKDGHTLRQSVELLQRSDLNVAGLGDLLDEMLSYHYDTLYRNVPADRSREKAFVGRLKRI